MSHKHAKQRRQKRRTESARRVHAALLEILTNMRRVFARRLKEQRQTFPKMRLPCETCAFRTTTDDWQGFENTVLSFVTALHTGAEFFCHENLEETADGWKPPLTAEGTIDYTVARPCSAWWVLNAEPQFQLADIGLDDEVMEKLCGIRLGAVAIEAVCEVPA